MEPIYVQNFEITDQFVDRFGRLRGSQLLFIVQEMGGRHCELLKLDYDALARHRMYWAVTRHRVQVTRLPHRGETIRVETWPMPTTHAAFPRSVVAYDEKGEECFRAISLWVLMDLDTRNMILPGKSGIIVPGTLRGTELAVPGGLIPRERGSLSSREVRFTDLDRNGHMNNTRYLEWMDDLFPSEFHRDHVLRELTVCYLAEAKEGQTLDMHYDCPDGSAVQVDATRTLDGETHRVFSAKLLFGDGEDG